MLRASQHRTEINRVDLYSGLLNTELRLSGLVLRSSQYRAEINRVDLYSSLQKEVSYSRNPIDKIDKLLL